MKKIPTLFQRTEDRRGVVDIVTPGCEWVVAGHGIVASRKWDGTCVRITHPWYDGPQVGAEFRREVKPGKTPPEHWIEADSDPVTGKRVGWEPYGDSGFAPFLDEVLGKDPQTEDWPEGTYELCGPKINGNPENLSEHRLFRHGAAVLDLPSVSFEYLRTALTGGLSFMEGIVWHHPDGRMAKLKRRDFTRVNGAAAHVTNGTDTATGEADA